MFLWAKINLYFCKSGNCYSLNLMRFLFFSRNCFCLLSSCNVDKRERAYIVRKKEIEASGIPNFAANAYRNAANISVDTNDKELQIEIYNRLGNLFLEYGVYDRAIEVFVHKHYLIRPNILFFYLKKISGFFYLLFPVRLPLSFKITSLIPYMNFLLHNCERTNSSGRKD